MLLPHVAVKMLQSGHGPAKNKAPRGKNLFHFGSALTEWARSPDVAATAAAGAAAVTAAVEQLLCNMATLMASSSNWNWDWHQTLAFFSFMHFGVLFHAGLATSCQAIITASMSLQVATS